MAKSHALLCKVAHEIQRASLDGKSAVEGKQWKVATVYCENYDQIAAARKAEGKPFTPQAINKELVSLAPDGPGRSFYSNAKRTWETFPEVFSVDTKKMGYTHYRVIAVSTLPAREKQRIREQAEAEQWTQKQLREEIRRRVDGQEDQPDFELKVGNIWKFNRPCPSGFDGGIHPDLVANVLHFFTDPGDRILEPMAGGRTTRKVLDGFRYFRETSPSLPYSGPRHLTELDADPVSNEVAQHDSRNPYLFDGELFDVALLDPPYYRIADGKYQGWGDSVDEWMATYRAVLKNTIDVLRPGGKVILIVDDVLRKEESVCLHGLAVAESIAQKMAVTHCIINNDPRFVYTMNATLMASCKKARLMCHQAKFVLVMITL